MARSSPLERVRRICLSLPDANERASHGSPTFFIRDKRSFVTYVDDHHGEHLGWIGVRLDRDLSWDEIDGVIRHAYQIVADKMPRPRAAKRAMRTAVTKRARGRIPST